MPARRSDGPCHSHWLYVHLVFSSKDRAPVLHPEISEKLHDYLAGIFDEIDSHSLKIGSAADQMNATCGIETPGAEGFLSRPFRA